MVEQEFLIGFEEVEWGAAEGDDLDPLPTDWYCTPEEAARREEITVKDESLVSGLNQDDGTYIRPYEMHLPERLKAGISELQELALKGGWTQDFTQSIFS